MLARKESSIKYHRIVAHQLALQEARNSGRGSAVRKKRFVNPDIAMVVGDDVNNNNNNSNWNMGNMGQPVQQQQLPPFNHRLRHSHHVLTQLRVYLSATPTEQDATIRCKDGDIQANKIVLAAMSSFLRSHMSIFADALIVVPGLLKSDVYTFFQYLFSESGADAYDCADLPAIAAVCKELAVDGLKLPEEEKRKEERVIKIPSTAKMDLLEEAVRETLSEGVSPLVGQRKRLSEVEGNCEVGSDKSTYNFHDWKDTGEKPQPPPPEEKMYSRKKRRVEKLKIERTRKRGDKRKTCYFCEKTYAVVRNRNLHMVSQHRLECLARGILVECGYCPEAFVSRRGRSRHQEEIHGIELEDQTNAASTMNIKDLVTATFKSKCHACGERFGDCQALRTHVSSLHPSKQLHCLMCDDPHSTKISLFEHIQTHRESPDNIFYQCHHCMMNFGVKYEMRQHVRRVHNPAPSFVCGECEMSFYNAKNLGRHVTREHGVDCTRPSYPCPHCERTFRFGSELERHMKKHTGVKDCVCDKCGKAVVDASRLKEHQMIQHPDMNPGGFDVFRCNVCDANFATRTHLSRHFETDSHKDKEALQKVSDIFREYSGMIARDGGGRREKEEEEEEEEQGEEEELDMEDEVVEEGGGGGEVIVEPMETMEEEVHETGEHQDAHGIKLCLDDGIINLSSSSAAVV